MTKIRLAYIQEFRDRHGRVRSYSRDQGSTVFRYRAYLAQTNLWRRTEPPYGYRDGRSA
jgi:hypothetical protein